MFRRNSCKPQPFNSLNPPKRKQNNLTWQCTCPESQDETKQLCPKVLHKTTGHPLCATTNCRFHIDLGTSWHSAPIFSTPPPPEFGGWSRWMKRGVGNSTSCQKRWWFMTWVVDFHGDFCWVLMSPRHPNTWWVGIWTPKHLLRRPLGVPNTSLSGIWGILDVQGS